MFRSLNKVINAVRGNVDTIYSVHIDKAISKLAEPHDEHPSPFSIRQYIVAIKIGELFKCKIYRSTNIHLLTIEIRKQLIREVLENNFSELSLSSDEELMADIIIRMDVNIRLLKPYEARYLNALNQLLKHIDILSK